MARRHGRNGRLYLGIATDTGQRWHPARLKESTRHWFEVGHVAYLRAVQRALDELEVPA